MISDPCLFVCLFQDLNKPQVAVVMSAACSEIIFISVLSDKLLIITLLPYRQPAAADHGEQVEPQGGDD